MPQRALPRSVGCSCILRATAHSGDRRPSARKLRAPAGPCALTQPSRHSVRVGLPDAGGLGDDAIALRLEKLEALTDTALTRLDVDDLLVELLGRVREILDVDTAAVLMLDADSEVLVARAACGIEDEVRQGVRIPLGTGFAGRIAATKQPVRLDHIDATTVANP